MSEVRTASGIILPAPEGQLRAWIKPRGEPALLMVEVPEVVYARIRDAEAAGDPHVAFHEWSYGHAVYIPRSWFLDTSISVSYKSHGTTTWGGIYAGNCPCLNCEAGVGAGTKENPVFPAGARAS